MAVVSGFFVLLFVVVVHAQNEEIYHPGFGSGTSGIAQDSKYISGPDAVAIDDDCS